MICIADPEKWNRDQVRAWLQFTVKQFKLPSMPDIERVFSEDGVQLSQLNEIDFINRLPQVCVSFAHLGWCLRTECDKKKNKTNLVEIVDLILMQMIFFFFLMFLVASLGWRYTVRSIGNMEGGLL